MERERFSAVCTAEMYDCDGALMCKPGEVYEFVPAPNPDEDGYYDIVKCVDGKVGWCNEVDIAECFLDAPI